MRASTSSASAKDYGQKSPSAEARPPVPPGKPPATVSEKSVGAVVKILGLAFLGIICLLIGGFALPGAQRKSHHVNPVPAAVNAAAVDSSVESAKKEPAKPAVAHVAAKPPAVLGVGGPASHSRYDPNEDLSIPADPLVVPQLPAGGGAFDMAVAIDRELDKALATGNIPASPMASDAEFIRRAYLDITGHIPSRERVSTFLRNQDPYKRSQLIDELLSDSNYGRHFAQLWTDLLIKRDFDSNKNLKTGPFVSWLAEQFNKNRGWDKIVNDILTAQGKEEQVPQTIFFLANQDNNQPSPQKLVGASANLFMGIQLQCAECHVHPFNNKWTQKDFWGMAAFFGHTRADRETDEKGKPKNGTATLHEVERRPQAKGKAAKKDKSKPILPGANIAVPDPGNPEKNIMVVKAKFFEGKMPALNEKPPYRQTFATWLTSKQDRYFGPAAVNRMWAHFFARGFVNPIEEMSDDNKASHPELLKTLTEDFTKTGFDLKYLIRAICNSKAYQRTSKPLTSNAEDETLFSKMPVKVMTAQMLLDSLALATEHQERDQGSRGRMGKGKKEAGPASQVRFFDTKEYDDIPTEFTYGIPQILRLMNSNLSHSSADVAKHLASENNGSRAKVIQDMYLTTLSRRPTPTEMKKMADFVARQGDPQKGFAGVFWALLNSAEFVSNH